MIRVRDTVTVSMLLLTAALARGQNGGASHARFPDWDSGGRMARAQAVSRQLHEAGIGPPPSQNVPPQVIRSVLDLLEKMDKNDLEKALRDPALAEKLKDTEFARKLGGIRPDDEELRKQLQQREPSSAERERYAETL